MRDPVRIVEILNALHTIWLRHPDVRFNQLLYNLQYEYATSHSPHSIVRNDNDNAAGLDLFYIEDDEFLTFLKSHSGEKNDVLL